MAVSPTYALAHVFLPNLTKLQGPHTLVAAVERGNKAFFEQVWLQAQLPFDPKIFFLKRDPYRCAMLELPPPRDAGDAHMIAVITRTTDSWFWRYFTLEQDYVLATRSFRTLICQREGAKHSKLGPGPQLTGDFERDAAAFADAALLPIITNRSLADGTTG
jgi:hypothetical protein